MSSTEQRLESVHKELYDLYHEKRPDQKRIAQLWFMADRLEDVWQEGE